jgi:uncharacterized protein involved in exopolysaccharide biosynthesis
MVKLFLLRFFETYFRHRWLYLMPIIIVLVAAVVYFVTLQPTYTAQGVLYVNNPSLLTSLNAVQNNNTNWWITPSQATANEISELLQTDAFVRAIIMETDLEQYMDDGPTRVIETIADVRRGILANSVGNNQLHISATAEYPEISYQLVPAIIDNYLNWQVSTSHQDTSVAQRFFVDLIEKYASELDNAKRALVDYHSSHLPPLSITERLEVTHLQNQIDLATDRHSSAMEKEENANLVMAQTESDIRQTYVLVDAPSVPDKPDLSKRKLAVQIASFISLGIALSLIAVTGSTVLDRSFRFPIDVETHLHLSVLAETPDVSPRMKWYTRFVPGFLKRKKSISDEENQIPLLDPSIPDSKLRMT